MGLPLSAAHLGAGTVEFACTSLKYLKNSFIQSHPRNRDPINRAVYVENIAAFGILPLILPALELSQTTHPKGVTDYSYTKWFMENQDTAYRLGKLHKMVIYCLLTNKILLFFPNAIYFLIVF